MTDHHVSILSYDHRSVGICACGGIKHREHFGDRRTAKAKRDIMLHLAEVAEAVSGEYQIGPRDALDCPVCSEELDFKRDDIPLLAEDEPAIIQCKNLHEFDTYYKDLTLFLFPENVDSHTPFNATW